MKLALTNEEQALLLDALGDLVDSVGPAQLLAAPIAPTPAFFPDRYTATADGARAVAERLLGYAGLGSLHAVVEAADAEAMEEHPGAAAWFHGIDGFECRFGVDERNLADAEALVAALAHEVAHAFRHHHRLVDRGALPEEPSTDATTVFLGFGIVTTIATERLRTWGEHRGTAGWTYSTHRKLGYLPPDAMAFLLAAQALARRAGRRERSRVAVQLEANQAAFFHAAHAALARREAEVIRRLRLAPHREGTPAPRPVRRVEQPAPVDPRALPPALRTDNRRRRVFRVTGRRSLGAAVVGTAVGALPFSIWWTVSHRPEPLVLGAIAAAWLGWRLARRRPDRCSDSQCEAELRPGVTVCPGCGGAIAGTLANANDRLEAEERLGHGERPEDADDELAS